MQRLPFKEYLYKFYFPFFPIAFRAFDFSNYDVVISEMSADAAFFSHVNRVLKDDGQFVSSNVSLEDIQATKNLMMTLAKYCKIIMPYNIGNASSALFCSKEYHPTADINLQRADMIDGLNYYNSDIHPASFAMGNYIRKEYLGIIKN